MLRDLDPEFNFVDSDEFDKYTLPYRRGVGMMVFNQEGKIFVGKRIASKNDAWQMPQGGIKDDETAMEAGYRELFEETNMIEIDVVRESPKWRYYDLPESLVNRLWDGQYRGQKQKWLLVRFYGPEAAIDITKSYAEFDQWKWINIEDVPSIAVPFKKNIYVSVVEEFKDLIKAELGPK